MALSTQILLFSLPDIFGSCNKGKLFYTDSIFVEAKNLEADFSYEIVPYTDQIQFINLSSISHQATGILSMERPPVGFPA